MANEKNIPFVQSDTKPIILQKSKQIFDPKKYELEELAKRYCEKK